MRNLRLGVAQLGPIQSADDRQSVVRRQIDMLQNAAACGVEFVVFPELAFTTFFPRLYIEEEHVLDRWFESEMPGEETMALFDTARQLGIGFTIGYAERVRQGDKDCDVAYAE